MSSTVQKDASMKLQKRMIKQHFEELARAPETKRPVVYTFVPGNLTELIWAFGALPVLPEINALQSGMRQKAKGYIAEAERMGHSADVCAYVKSDIGMLASGNVGPTGSRLPEPDLLLLSYTGCFTFMKWFELLRERYDCEVCMLHVPYQAEGKWTESQRDYVVKQLREEVIPALEKVTGRSYDEAEMQLRLQRSKEMEDDFVWILKSARQQPTPIDAYFGAVYYMGPLFSFFRGTEDGREYYRLLRKEVTERLEAGRGPVTPDGPMTEERYRLVIEGPPCWPRFRDMWRMFADEGAVCVASTYSKVGGLYDLGFRHSPERPLETMAEYCLGCYTNLSLPARRDLICRYIDDYDADGFLVHSVKSCNSFSAGQLLLLREVEERTGVPGGFIESDLVDARYFSASNIKNRLESYLQVLSQKKGGTS